MREDVLDRDPGAVPGAMHVRGVQATLGEETAYGGA
jgi:hypothetical protein